MGSEDIKSGSEVVSEFLGLLHGDEVIDADTLAAVGDLFKTGKLTRSRLLGALDALRASATTQATNAASEGDAPSHD